MDALLWFPRMAALLTVRARRPGASKAAPPPRAASGARRNRPHLEKSSEGLPHVVAAERPELVLGVGHVPEGLRKRPMSWIERAAA